jgi:hypothetical protein
MLFVSLCTLRPGAYATATKKRLSWRHEGLKIVSEYWLATNHPAVIITTEGDDPTPVFQTIAEWSDVFDVQTYPAITGEQGVAMASAALAAHGVAIPAGAPAPGARVGV